MTFILVSVYIDNKDNSINSGLQDFAFITLMIINIVFIIFLVYLIFK